MAAIKGNMLIAHGGGPTPVINASLAGALAQAKKHAEIQTVFGARFGAEGILGGDLIDLTAVPQSTLERLPGTPASAIGSCRRKLTDADYPDVLGCFEKFGIRYFFYNGGNDSMDTCNKINELALRAGYDVRVIGIPKTIDNDLAVTDHSPGYGSAARYAAMSALELSFDASALPIHVVVMELMGRNAGWITAASAVFSEKMPCEHLVYLPEVPFDRKKFVADVTGAFDKKRGLLVTISEGLKYADGRPIGDTGITDGFGHVIPGGAAQAVADMIIADTSLKSRAEKPGLLGRVSMAWQSAVDREEAYRAGAYAVEAAVSGKSGFMVSIDAVRAPSYQARMALAPLAAVANTEKKFPAEWLNRAGNGVTGEFLEYCMPLVGEADTDFASLR